MVECPDSKLVEALFLHNPMRKSSRGGVENTRLEAKAKDTKKFRGQGTYLLEAKAKDQGHRRKCTQKKKRSSKIFFRRAKKKRFSKIFSGKKGLQNFFFRRSLIEETKKKVFADFPQDFWRFPTKFQRFKNSAVLEPRTGQFSGT